MGVLGLRYSALVIIAFSPLPLVSYPQGGWVGVSNFLIIVHNIIGVAIHMVIVQTLFN